MWDLVLKNLIPIVFVIATPVVLVMVRGLVTLVAKKLHMEWLLNYEGQVEHWVEMGIEAIEKKSLNAVKSGGMATPNEVKMQAVIDFVTSQLNQHNLPVKAADALANLVEHKLFGGTGTVTP
jgi:hypothetical protein